MKLTENNYTVCSANVNPAGGSKFSFNFIAKKCGPGDYKTGGNNRGASRMIIVVVIVLVVVFVAVVVDLCMFVVMVLGNVV